MSFRRLFGIMPEIMVVSIPANRRTHVTIIELEFKLELFETALKARLKDWSPRPLDRLGRSVWLAEICQNKANKCDYSIICEETMHGTKAMSVDTRQFFSNCFSVGVVRDTTFSAISAFSPMNELVLRFACAWVKVAGNMSTSDWDSVDAIRTLCVIAIMPTIPNTDKGSVPDVWETQAASRHVPNIPLMDRWFRFVAQSVKQLW